MSLVPPRPVKSSWSRNRAESPALWAFLNHWTTREILPSAVFFVLIWSHAKPPWAGTALVAPRILLPNPHDFLLTSLQTMSLLLDSVSVSFWTHSLNSVHAFWFSHFLLLSKSPALILTTMLPSIILPEWNPPHSLPSVTRLSQWLPWNLFIFVCDIKFQPPHLGCLYWPT